MYVEAIITPRVNYDVHVITCVMSWHASSCVNYTSLSRVNNALHDRFWHFTHVKLRGTTHVHECRNEVIIERYRTLKWLASSRDKLF